MKGLYDEWNNHVQGIGITDILYTWKESITWFSFSNIVWGWDPILKATVKRNTDRFPEDFIFELTIARRLSQIVKT